MAGCVPCFVIPLLLFIFHRYIQPLLLKIWNPWGKKEDAEKTEKPTFSFADCPCKSPENLSDGDKCEMPQRQECKLKSS